MIADSYPDWEAFNPLETLHWCWLVEANVLGGITFQQGLDFGEHDGLLYEIPELLEVGESTALVQQG